MCIEIFCCFYQEASWNSTIKKFADDIDGKLDRLELDPLKEWLESRLKALNDKLRRQQAQVEWTEDDAAGIRKYADETISINLYSNTPAALLYITNVFLFFSFFLSF